MSTIRSLNVLLSKYINCSNIICSKSISKVWLTIFFMSHKAYHLQFSLTINNSGYYQSLDHGTAFYHKLLLVREYLTTYSIVVAVNVTVLLLQSQFSRPVIFLIPKIEEPCEIMTNIVRVIKFETYYLSA